MNSRRVQTPDGIDWYIESTQTKDAGLSTNPEHIILVPSGEGDCHNLAALALQLASTAPNGIPTIITTFDMPGFSRTKAPASAYEIVTPSLIAKQIVTLLDTLRISNPTIFGCSSGGGTTLGILTLCPDHLKAGIVHEVPLAIPPAFLEFKKLPDDKIIELCTSVFESWHERENQGKEKYKALGPAYFARRDPNFITWMHHLVANFENPTMALCTPDRLRKKPLFWTVGGLSPPDLWRENYTVMEAAGLSVRNDRLMCNHFPAVTVPVETAAWIWECIGKVNEMEKV